MEIPPHWRLRMSDIIAEYMINRFLEAIGRPIRPTSLPDTSIPLSAVFEADRIVQSMAKAYQNQRSFPINIRRMVESLGPNETGKIPPIEEAQGDRYRIRPSLLDQTGALSRSVSNSRSWRTEEELFGGGEVRGAIELSPAWYQQGCLPFRHMPEVSALLKDSNEDPGPRKWLQASSLQTAILSASLIQWLDMLATIGGDPELHMELDTLGVGLFYGPGTVLALSGKVLQHGVPPSAMAGVYLRVWVTYL
ncbi:hypothetical protein BU15DRAFT_68675 [Melanogaster broomeanus]|nr:hypothetical protein BU15DRAFT_68675 [Melanogaster broomeanus]